MKTCQLCGKTTSKKIFCKICLNKIDYNILKKDSNGTWIENKNNVIPNSAIDFLNYHRYEKCIICDCLNDDGSAICKDCITKINNTSINFIDFDKNDLIIEYDNTINNLMNFKEQEKVKFYLIKLICIAKILYEIFSYIDKMLIIIDDITYFTGVTLQKKFDGSIVYHNNQRSCIQNHKRAAKDGHYVKSVGEEIIDNILYNNRIIHCYEYLINTQNIYMICDWFIPIINVNNKEFGIYIEYFGISSKDNYVERKRIKLDQYRSLKLPLIAIEKYETNNPTKLEKYIIDEINRLKIEITKDIFDINNIL